MATERWVALLYSVVLGPERRVRMADLRAMASQLGLEEPRTLVSSGNLVFGGAGPEAALETRLEAAFAQAFGRRLDILVRGADDWRRLAAGNPFRSEAERAHNSVHVRVMRAPFPEAELPRLEAARAGDERLALVGGDLWLHLPHGAGRSRVGTAAGASRTGVGTFRNWNTVRRLAAMLDE